MYYVFILKMSFKRKGTVFLSGEHAYQQRLLHYSSMPSNKVNIVNGKDKGNDSTPCVHTMLPDDICSEVFKQQYASFMTSIESKLETLEKRLAHVEHVVKVNCGLNHRHNQHVFHHTAPKQSAVIEPLSNSEKTKPVSIVVTQCRRKKRKAPVIMIGKIVLNNVHPLTNRTCEHIVVSKFDSRVPVNSVWQQLFHHSRLSFKKPQHVTAETAKLTNAHVAHIKHCFEDMVQKQMEHFEKKSGLDDDSLFAKWDTSNVLIIRYPPQTSWGKWHFDVSHK